MNIYHLPIPPSTNRIWRSVNGRNIKSREYRVWLEEAGWELRAQKPKLLTDAVAVCLRIPRNNRRDLDGYIKPILDLLQHGGVVANDKQVEDLRALWIGADEPLQVAVYSADRASLHVQSEAAAE